MLVPAGTYLSGSIRLKSNINLLIAFVATILGAPQAINVYDETGPFSVTTFQDTVHTFFINSLTWGENLTNFFITGNGMIISGGLVRDDGALDKISGFDHWQKPDSIQLALIHLGNKAIALKLCKNVLISDVTIFHGGPFAIIVTGCDNMTIDNVTMDTNRDGIDIDC